MGGSSSDTASSSYKRSAAFCKIRKHNQQELEGASTFEYRSSIEIEDPCITVLFFNEMGGPRRIAEDSIDSIIVTASEQDSEIMDANEQPQAKITRSIVFVTGEAAPYAKSGGLGDVCGSLPIALAARGHRVMVVMPRYLNGSSDKNYAKALYTAKHIQIPCFGGSHEVTFFHEYRDNVDWVFVDHPSYHRPGSLYGDNFGAFGDNQFRYTLLCYAACEAPLILELGGYIYGQNCMFVVNDWHASLVPVLLAAKYRPYGVYRDSRSTLVIHNLAHQGVEPASTYPDLGLPPEWYGALEWVFPEWARRHALDKGEAVNFLKGAVVTADRIVTVSQAKCKAELQKELGLPVREDVPLLDSQIGFIGRLDYQKGIDLIKMAIPDLMREDVQFVMLGSGDPVFEGWMRSTESSYKDKFRGWVGFSVPVSHRITAGCDILLMPSRFEPCGLNQLYAMQYGTVPVVHGTGGLRDTVETFNPFGAKGEEGTGWAFSPLTVDKMLWALRTAMSTFREHKPSWEGLMKRGMTKDHTWDHAAEQYEQIFEWAFVDQPYVM
ncbi:Starch synthase 1, chloroplastic/amyloplastic [Triticum urartu]|uniref:starch synthase n=1 Tax=Triticum urartu TaxID=4572 RepID=M7Z5A9_TRIUA|nr:Starch synthase 1, chloroplastic/amyloplastic [Triticum urartu]